MDRRKRKPKSQSPPATRRGSAASERKPRARRSADSSAAPPSRRLHPPLRPPPGLRLAAAAPAPAAAAAERAEADSKKEVAADSVLRSSLRDVERSPLIKSLRPMARLAGESSAVSRLNARRMPAPTGHRQPSLPPMRSSQLQLRQQQSAGLSVPAARSTSQQTGLASSDCRSRKSSI